MIRLVLIAALLAACTPTAPAGASPTATAPATAPASTATATAAMSQTAVPGTPTVSIGMDGHFVGPNGMSLYTFDRDSADTSACSGDCLVTWPALTVPAAGAVTVGGLDSADFATITRSDGSLQVTFNHLPLYYYAGDSVEGDTNGDGVGGVWHLATAASASPSQPPSPAASPYSNDPAY